MMREILKDYLSILLSAITLSVLLFGWASDVLDNRINEAVTKAMTPFAEQLDKSTQAIYELDKRLEPLEALASTLDENAF